MPDLGAHTVNVRQTLGHHLTAGLAYQVLALVGLGMQTVQIVLLLGLLEPVGLTHQLIGVTQSGFQVRSQVNTFQVRYFNAVKPFSSILSLRSRFQNTLTQSHRPLHHLHILLVCGNDALMEKQQEYRQQQNRRSHSIKHTLQTQVGLLEQNGTCLITAVQTDVLLNLQVNRTVVVRCQLVIESRVSQTHLFTQRSHALRHHAVRHCIHPLLLHDTAVAAIRLQRLLLGTSRAVQTEVGVQQIQRRTQHAQRLLIESALNVTGSQQTLALNDLILAAVRCRQLQSLQSQLSRQKFRIYVRCVQPGKHIIAHP